MNRKKYNKGDILDKDDFPVLDEETFEPADIEDLLPKPTAGDKSIKDNLINKQIEKLEIQKELTDDIDLEQKINNQIEKLKSMKTKKTAATGGLLKMSIGGEAGLSEKYDRRRDYQAYQEGDIVEDESLMSPPEMNPNMQMDEMNEMEDDDMGNMDAVVDTSALSEDEEKVVDDAVEMFPELEAIIPKIVATEFTEDGEVEGPGTGTSDSIPALLSDGEFVFTAKAVKHIGVDKLRKMMKDAEAAYDAGMQSQEADAEMADMQE